MDNRWRSFSKLSFPTKTCPALEWSWLFFRNIRANKKETCIPFLVSFRCSCSNLDCMTIRNLSILSSNLCRPKSYSNLGPCEQPNNLKGISSNWLNLQLSRPLNLSIKSIWKFIRSSIEVVNLVGNRWANSL